LKIMSSVNASHGLLFISDPKDKGTGPLDTGAKNVTFTDTCIAFWVIHEVDGAAAVQLTNEDVIPPLPKRFTGVLTLQSGVVSISQPDHTSIADLDVKSKKVKINIYSNDNNNPDQIVVKVEPIV